MIGATVEGPYQPLLFWVGLVILAAGLLGMLVLWLKAGDSSQRPSAKAGAMGNDDASNNSDLSIRIGGSVGDGNRIGHTIHTRPEPRTLDDAMRARLAQLEPGPVDLMVADDHETLGYAAKIRDELRAQGREVGWYVGGSPGAPPGVTFWGAANGRYRIYVRQAPPY